ncbi:MAG: hypothetical protein U9P70_01540 [Patescibacteria group bacterium]|nr:hypothetical protein [Patescibacteria group bacterium]
MKTKKSLELILYLFVVLFVFFVLSFFICHPASSLFGLALSAFIINILCVLFAMLFWFISPIGVLFFLGIKLSFDEKTSTVRRNFAVLLQFLSFLSWSSLMFILMVVYIDSVSYKILNLGSDILNLAIKSGFGFVIFMFILIVAEKRMISFQKYDSKRKNNKNFNNSNETRRKGKREKEESIKIAGIEIGGIKRKVKHKLKEDLKKIVNKEIDRRL